MQRRDFLKGTSLVTLSPVIPLLPANGGEDARAFSAQTFSQTQWSTIAAVQDHLLPSERDAPGARDLNATAFLDRTLADPKFDPDVKGFILQGIGWLEEISQETHALTFHRVKPARREDLLRQIAGSGAGERWLSTLISYSVEAMLAGPLYGGNPDGIGWK